MVRKQRLVVGNWKMHPRSLSEAKRLFGGIARRVSTNRSARVVVCPPLIYTHALAQGYRGTKVHFGAQDLSVFEKEGSYTGEISGHLLASVGVAYVIVGHSERRALGESDETVSQKMAHALSAGLTPILCVGERERDPHGSYLTDLERQLRTSLSSVSRARAKKIVVAYEPIWAIGKSAKDAITLHELHEMSIFIKKILTKLYGRTVGMNIRILYGGSVEGANSEELAQEESIDGFLVGHASLSPEEFTDIVRHA